MNPNHVWSLVGGMFIGLSASLLLLVNGRIAGISSIVGELLRPGGGDIGWRVAFLLGLITTGVVATLVSPESFAVAVDRHVVWVGLAGLLVGFGTRLGNGCTSGHGVCGLSRLSIRSLIATLTFIGTGALAVFVSKLLRGGGS